MKALEKNVTNVWGNKGQDWLHKLPNIISQLTRHWNLSDVSPVANMSYNYVAKAKQNNHIPVILKVSCDRQLIENEYQALHYYHGNGAIKVLARYADLNALLLEQAIPGMLLKECHSNNEKTIQIYADVVKTLVSQSQAPSSEFTHVENWCQAIDRIQDKQVNTQYVAKAKALRKFLLSSAETQYLCHGDLHSENILLHKNKWLSIDPKGILGEIPFEAAAFDLIDKNEWLEPNTIQAKIIARLNLLASALAIDKHRLMNWVFLRALISIQWFIEDKGNPDEMLKLASAVYPLLAIKY